MPAPAEVVMERPEEELVARCRAGDVTAFGEIYARYEQAIFRFAYRMLGNREDANDIRQETFLRAYRAMPAFRGDCSLQTWLFRVCANLCRSHARSRSYHESYCRWAAAEGSPESHRERADPAALVDRSHTTAIIRQALRSLPPAQRELIVWREYEELSCEQIAGILGCAPATVRVKLFRARRRLKERVESLLNAR